MPEQFQEQACCEWNLVTLPLKCSLFAKSSWYFGTPLLPVCVVATSGYYCSFSPGIMCFSSTQHYRESELLSNQWITAYGHLQTCLPYQFGQQTTALAVTRFPSTEGEDLAAFWTNLECMCRRTPSTTDMERASLHVYSEVTCKAYSFYISLCLKMYLKHYIFSQ